MSVRIYGPLTDQAAVLVVHEQPSPHVHMLGGLVSQRGTIKIVDGRAVLTGWTFGRPTLLRNTADEV